MNSATQLGGEPARLPQVSAQFDEIGNALERQEKIIAELTDRLRDILMPGTPLPAATGRLTPPSPPEPCLAVPLADRLKSIARKIGHANRDLNELISRIEL